MSESNSVKTVINLFWRFLERCGAQVVALVVSWILARVLGPEEYGTIAMVTVFTTIMQVFVDSGLGNALIQKKDADNLDFSTVFYFNVVVCVLMYSIMFFAAPLISDFYENPELTPIVRVQSLMLIISGVRNVQQAYVSRHMLFKRFFLATLGGTIGAAVVGIVMAYLGFGVWSLVAQYLFNLAASTALLWITVKWRPTKAFSFERLKALFTYGWKILISKLLDTLYNEARQLIIGKVYTESDLAFYNEGKKLPHLAVTDINSSIDSVLLPTMSNVQDDKSRVCAMTRRSIKISTYIMMPVMLGLAVCAEPLITLMLTEKWLPCVPYLRVFCITYAFYPIHTANLNAIKAMGRSDLFLILEIIKKAIGVVLLLVTMFQGVMVMAYSLLVSTLIASFVNAFPNKKLLGYSYLQQIKDMLPQVGLSVVMAAIVYCVEFLNLHPIVTLLIQIPLGVLIYVAGSKLFKVESFEYILSMIKNLLGKRKKQEETK